MKRDWIIIGSGPSLTVDQVSLIKKEWESPNSRLGVVTVNDNYKLFNNPDVVFAADRHWWRDNYDEVDSLCPDSELIVLKDHNPFKRSRLEEVKHSHSTSPLDKDVIYHGGNSGQMSIDFINKNKPNINSICLVGFDFQFKDGKKHWFGDHPKKYKSEQECMPKWLKTIIHQASITKTPLFNASIETAIPEEVIPRISLNNMIFGTDNHLH